MDQRDCAEEASNRADMVREGQQEANEEEYRALIDSGVRTRKAVDRIAQLVGGDALLGLLDHGRNS